MTRIPQEHTMPSLQTLPRAAVHGYLRVLRLPVDAAGLVARRNQDAPWPPSVAFESFESKVKGVAGSILRDDDLRDESATQRARVEKLRTAIEAETAAKAKKAVADRRVKERLQEAGQRDELAESREQAEKERARQSKAEAKEATRRRTTRQKRSATRAEQARKQSVAEKAKATKAETLAGEREALLERKQAAQAKAAARELGDAADATRAHRKTGS
jgi:hypothetical protein